MKLARFSAFARADAAVFALALLLIEWAKQRLIRGLTVATPTTACPTAPTDATASAGHAPFNESYSYELRDVFDTSAGRTYNYAANTPPIGVTCASGTETAKPDAVSSTTGTATHPQNKIWYECNGAMMSRSQTGAGVNNRISYAWDDGMRLEAVAQGTPVTWSTSTGGTGSISHRSSSSANSGASGASSLTISRPAGVAASDVLVAGIMVNSSTVTITPPAGWTLQTTVSNGSDNMTVVYTKVATASEPTSYGFTFSFNVKSAGAISAYTGVNTSSPVNVVNTGTNAVQIDQVAPSVTTTAANTMVVRVWGTRKDTSVTPPAGVTERADTNSTGTGSVALAIGDSTQTTAAASGTATATAATTGSGAHVTIALTPATTGGSGLVGVTVDANTNDLITASTLDGTTYNAGAVSTQTLTGDGAVSFRIRGPKWFVGLNDTNTGGAGFAEIDYAIVIGSAGHIEVYEAGVLKCNLACSTFQNRRDSDLFSIQRTGNTVTYLRNGRTFYTSTVPATAAGYYVDTSAASPHSRIGDVLISTGNSGVERHVYDVNGQRVLRIEPTGTKTIYLGNTELRWTPANSSVVQVVRYYPGGTERGFDGTVRYAVHGHQGSLLATINATSGAITHNRYLPYGTMRAGSSPNDKAFLGQTTDKAINLIYLNNRYHDPTLGTFISVDPLVSVTGEPYIYASGNPTTLSDPTGLCSVSHHDGETCSDAKKRMGGCGGTSRPPFILEHSRTSPVNNQARWSYASGRVERMPQRGVIRFNAFIPSSTECIPYCKDGQARYAYEGDDRSFDSGSTPFESRFSIEINYETGLWEAFANYTCNLDGTCGDAYPVHVAQLTFPGYIPSSPPTPDGVEKLNYALLLVDSGNTGLGLRYEINNPIQPLGASITADGTFGFEFGPDGLVDIGTFNCACDDFPSLEVYQFRGDLALTIFTQSAGSAVIDLWG